MAYGDNRTEVATDDFNSGINTSNWSNGDGQWNDFAAVSSQIETTNPGGTSAGMRRIASGETYDNDQYSTVEIGNLGSGSDFYGVCARMQAGTDESCYTAYLENFTPEYAIYIVNSSLNFTRLDGASFGGTAAVGDKITIEVEGTTIRCGCDNPTSDVQRVSTTDATLSSGAPGVTALRGSADIRLDNWTGGNIGAVAYTIAADSGSMAITGSAADLLFDRQIGADAGSVAISGVAADLLFGRLVDAEAGAVAITGVAADLIADRILGADAGSVAISGVAADLLFGRLVDAEAGAVAISGVAADLLVGWFLDAEAGAVVLTGLDATLIYTPAAGTYELVADAGSMAISGVAADLLFDRQLGADAGSVAISGVAADLLFGRLVDAEAGAVAITGVAADLLVGWFLDAEAGAVVLTGADAVLDWSGAILVPIVLATEQEVETTISGGQRFNRLAAGDQEIETTITAAQRLD